MQIFVRSQASNAAVLTKKFIRAALEELTRCPLPFLDSLNVYKISDTVFEYSFRKFGKDKNKVLVNKIKSKERAPTTKVEIT